MTDIAVLSVPIEADTKQIDDALRRIEQQLDRAGRGGRGAQIGEPFARAVPAISQAERATLSFAQARARLLRDQGNLAGAERVLQGALRQTTATTTATISAERQLLAVRKQIEAASAGATRGTAGFAASLKGIVGAAGALGIGLGVGALVQFGTAAGQAAVSLERTQATLRAVAGSQERYNDVLRIAQANQKLFGGSLEQNLGPLQQFLFIANRSGASLEELNRVAQLLATVNPAEGIAGAGFALSEALSGDLTSIVERFNLPRQAIRDLLNEAQSADQVLGGITKLLADQGVSAETLSASLTDNATAYARLAAAGEDAFTRIGTAAANAGRPIADALAGVLEAASAGAERTEASGGMNAAALDPLIQAGYEALTGAVRAYADAQIAAGASTGQALAQARALQREVSGLALAWDDAATSGTDIEARLFAIAGASEQGYQQALYLATQWRDGAISSAQLAASVGALEVSMAAAATAAQEAADADAALAGEAEAAASMLDFSTNAANAQEAALRLATQAAYDAAAADGDLEAQARAAAQALLDAGPAGAEAAAQLAASSADIDVMTAAFYRLEAAKRAALGGGGALGDLGGVVKGAGQATAAIRALNKVYGAGPLAPRGGGGGGARGGRGGGGGGASAAAKEAERQAKDQAALYDKLTGIQDRYHEQALAAEQRYQERLAAIAAEYAKKRAEAERRFADAQSSTKAGFYTSLASADKADRTQLIQEFEAAKDEAARIAETVGAEAGEAYLDEITGIIKERLERQKAIEQALKDGDKDEAEFLRGIDQIAREDEQRRLDAIKRGEGGLGAEEQAAKDEAAARRAEDLAAAQLDAQDALAEAERRKTDAAQLTNEQLAEQLRLTREIVQAGGAVTLPAASPASAAQPAAATSPAVAGSAGAAGAVTVASAPSLEALLGQITAAVDGVRRAVQASGHTRPGV